jgi:hypothetical protein
MCRFDPVPTGHAFDFAAVVSARPTFLMEELK